jgi:hypothetical protein
MRLNQSAARWYGLLLVSAVALVASSCDSAYYRTMSILGKEKRDILVSRVTDARDGQQAAKKEFQTALEKLNAVTKPQGGSLTGKYDEFKSEVTRCESRAETVHQQIAKVEDVGKDLFKEWESELKQYKEADLRLASESELRQTQQRQIELLRVMKRSEQKMQVVLTAFRDQVLYLKHNLDARAVSPMPSNAGALRTDMAALVTDMEAAVREATAFIDDMNKP